MFIPNWALFNFSYFRWSFFERMETKKPDFSFVELAHFFGWVCHCSISARVALFVRFLCFTHESPPLRILPRRHAWFFLPITTKIETTMEMRRSQENSARYNCYIFREEIFKIQQAIYSLPSSDGLDSVNWWKCIR